MSYSKPKICAKCASSTAHFRYEKGLPVCEPICARDAQLDLLSITDAEIAQNNLRYALTGSL